MKVNEIAYVFLKDGQIINISTNSKMNINIINLDEQKEGCLPVEPIKLFPVISRKGVLDTTIPIDKRTTLDLIRLSKHIKEG